MSKLNLGIVIATILFQVGLLGAYFFTWQGLLLFCVLYVITGLGITIGFHRLLTHGSFETYRPIKYAFALLGQLSAEGSAVWWVAVHRKHHQYSDTEHDPHSPIHGFWWAHVLWALPKRDDIALIKRYAPDLWNDPVLRCLHYMFIPNLILFALMCYMFGLIWSPYVALSCLCWGFFVRTWWVQHVTWLVNSATHTWGYQNYYTGDRSKNLWWVALLSFGEGWHNNHHKYPTWARHGHKWWELDISYYVIYLMSKMGLVWNIK